MFQPAPSEFGRHRRIVPYPQDIASERDYNLHRHSPLIQNQFIKTKLASVDSNGGNANITCPIARSGAASMSSKGKYAGLPDWILMPTIA